MTVGFQEALLLFGIALLLFGASRIPEIFRGFGEGIREFKKAVKEEPKDEAKGE